MNLDLVVDLARDKGTNSLQEIFLSAPKSEGLNKWNQQPLLILLNANVDEQSVDAYHKPQWLMLVREE
jgi:hypothetical protein